MRIVENLKEILNLNLELYDERIKIDAVRDHDPYNFSHNFYNKIFHNFIIFIIIKYT